MTLSYNNLLSRIDLDEPARYVPINPLTPQNFSGRSLRILSYLTNTKIGDWFINPFVLKVLGIARFRTLNLNDYQGLFCFEVVQFTEKACILM